MEQNMLAKIGAAFATATVLVHVFIGHFDTLLPLLSSDLPPAVLGAFHACWHFISLFLAYSAWRFWHGGPVVTHLAFFWIAFAAVFVAVGLWQFGLNGLLVLPQWILLGPTGAFILGNSLLNKNTGPQICGAKDV